MQNCAIILPFCENFFFPFFFFGGEGVAGEGYITVATPVVVQNIIQNLLRFCRFIE